MPITLDVSGTNMVIKVLRGPGWETERDLIKKLPGRMPIYKLNLEGVSAFSHWEVPLAEFGNLLSVIDKSQILLSSDKAKSLMNKFLLSTTGLQELPPFDGEIAWKRPPRYPEQEQYIRLSKDKDRVILALSPGLGKAQPLYSKVLTPNGFKTMGNIKVGDYVMGANGDPTKVLEVHPQGIRPIYRVTFSDRTYVDCDANHLWAVTKKWARRTNKPPQVKTTQELLDLGLKAPCGDRLWYVPMVSSINFASQDTPVDPYILGMLLGDGGLTVPYTVSFTTLDEELVMRLGDYAASLGLITQKQSKDQKNPAYRVTRGFRKYGHTTLESRNALVVALRSLGLLPIKCENRYIPDCYKYNTVDVRLAVLRGLMDTDGHVRERDSNTEVMFKSKRLLDDLCEIVESLGGNAYKRKKLINKTWYYGANLVLTINPFSLYRKSQVWRKPVKYFPYRVIDSIKLLGNEEAQCIVVEAEDHLYVTDNYTVTHNSNCSLLRASIFQPKRVLVVGPSKNNFTTWRSEVEKSTNWTIIKYHGSPQKRKKLRESGELLKFDVVYTTYTVLHELVDTPFDQIIYDEAHTICNSKTKNAKNAKKIVNKNPEAGLQLLSGTPIQHKPKDLWFLVHLINPQIAGDEWAWGKKYEKVLETMKRRIPLKSGGEYLKDDSGKVLTKLIEIPIKTCAQNLDHLVDRVKSIMFRLKRDKYVNFEERVDFEYVEMTPAQKKMYKEAREELFLELSTGQLKLSQEKLGRITRFLQICEGCFNLDPNMQDSGKLEYLFDELDAAQDKVIVWSRFKPITEILHAKYKNRSVIYNGDYGQNHKDVAILNFQGAETKQDMADWERLNKAKFSKPGEAQFFFGTMDKGTTAGLNLDACYRQYIPSFPWNGNTLEQTCARIKRLNQQASEVFTTLIVTESPNNFEEQALQLVLKNYATTLQILDGEGDVTYNQVQDLLKLLK